MKKFRNHWITSLGCHYVTFTIVLLQKSWLLWVLVKQWKSVITVVLPQIPQLNSLRFFDFLEMAPKWNLFLIPSPRPRQGISDVSSLVSLNPLKSTCETLTRILNGESCWKRRKDATICCMHNFKCLISYSLYWTDKAP